MFMGAKTLKETKVQHLKNLVRTVTFVFQQEGNVQCTSKFSELELDFLTDFGSPGVDDKLFLLFLSTLRLFWTFFLARGFRFNLAFASLFVGQSNLQCVMLVLNVSLTCHLFRNLLVRLQIKMKSQVLLSERFLNRNYAQFPVILYISSIIGLHFIRKAHMQVYVWSLVAACIKYSFYLTLVQMLQH